jgi:hypothetical protein
MPILATLLASWAIGATPTALAAPEPSEAAALDPAIVQACLAEGGAEADCIAQAQAAAAIGACVAGGHSEAECIAALEAQDDAKAQPAIDADPSAAQVPAAAQVAAAAAGQDDALTDAPAGEPLDEAPAMEPGEYLALLREVLRSQKEVVAQRLEEKIAAKQDEKMATMSQLLGWLSLGGLLLLLLPLSLRRKYPGQEAMLFKYSALAAGVCVAAIFLFSRVLLLLRAIQGALSSVTNPQVAVIDATFQVLDDNVEDLVDVGPVLIEAPLAQVAAGEQDSLPMAILDNVSKINEDITIFKTIARQFEGVFALFGYLPIVLTIVAVVLFVLSIKPVILEIVALPGRVAAGEARAADVVKEVFRTVGRELLATLCLIITLVVVTIFSGIMLTLAVEPAIEAFLAYVFTALMYTIAAPEFSKFAVYASVMGALMFLVLNVAAVLVTNVLFLGKAQKIFKRRFHERVPLSAHRRFWGWGSLSLVWAQVLPILFVAGAREGIGALIDKLTEGDDIPWTAVLLSGPAILVFGFVIVYWAARGLKAVSFILKYRPQDAPAGASTPADQPGARGRTARYRAT